MTARRPCLIGRHGPTAAGYLVFAAVVAVVGGGTYATCARPGDREALGATSPAGAVTPPAHAGRARVAPAPARAAAAPSAREFGTMLVGTANAYARAHGETRRLSRPHCVPGGTGRYMCVYVVRRAGRRPECHLVQAAWTPGRVSSFTVTLGGRVRKCGSIRQAIRSL